MRARILAFCASRSRISALRRSSFSISDDLRVEQVHQQHDDGRCNRCADDREQEIPLTEFPLFGTPGK